MTWYEFLLFVHVAAVVAWVGSGFLLIVLALRAERTDDAAAIKQILDWNSWLATHLFIPASLTVVAAGVWLTIDGPWEFDQLWVALGLLGYLSTFVTGVAVLRPRGDKIAAAMARDGGQLTPQSLADTRRLLALARIDYVTLFLVIAVMITKPTGDDGGLLAVLAAIWLAGLAWSLNSARAVAEPATA